jgi:hypothetical protein
MKIYSINDLSNSKVVDILKKEFSKILDLDIITNYHPDYSQTVGNLFYILEHGRYKIGKYYIIVDDDDNFIASSGWNQYEFDSSVALLLTRMFVNPKYRTQYYIGNYVLPIMIDETSNYEFQWITCNEHTSMIYKWFDRAAQGKRTAIFNDWPEIYKKFKPIGKKTIYYTEQYVAELNNNHINKL